MFNVLRANSLQITSKRSWAVYYRTTRSTYLRRGSADAARRSSAGTGIAKGPSLRCPNPEALQVRRQPVCDRGATADPKGAWHMYTRSRLDCAP